MGGLEPPTNVFRVRLLWPTELHGDFLYESELKLSDPESELKESELEPESEL